MDVRRILRFALVHCLHWSVENDETWVDVYSGVWRMMRHGWVFTVVCGE